MAHPYHEQKQALKNLETALDDDASPVNSSREARCCFVAAAVFGFSGVAAGAFGAHALKPHLQPKYYDAYETGVRYQFYHVAACLACAALLVLAPKGSRSCSQLQWAGRLFIVSTVLFSGSLYALALSSIDLIGIVTPFGGVGFLVAWSLLGLGGSSVLAALEQQQQQQGSLSPITPGGCYRTTHQGPIQLTPTRSGGYVNPEFQAVA